MDETQDGMQPETDDQIAGSIAPPQAGAIAANTPNIAMPSTPTPGQQAMQNSLAKGLANYATTTKPGSIQHSGDFTYFAPGASNLSPLSKALSGYAAGNMASQ